MLITATSFHRMKIAEAFRIVLRREREKLGLSQTQYIDKTGLDRRTVQNYELAERTPVFRNIIILAKALEMTPGTLVDLVMEELEKHPE